MTSQALTTTARMMQRRLDAVARGNSCYRYRARQWSARLRWARRKDERAIMNGPHYMSSSVGWFVRQYGAGVDSMCGGAA